MASISRMVVVGLDGATFRLIKPWVEAGKLPTFARLLAAIQDFDVAKVRYEDVQRTALIAVPPAE